MKSHTFSLVCEERNGRKVLTVDTPAAYASMVQGVGLGQVLEMEIREQGKKRSDRQVRGFHAMVMPWARDEGHAIEDLKVDLLREIFGEHEVVSLVTGQATKVLNEPHTSKLTMAQYSELIERTMQIAARMGYVLIAPDEWRRAQEEAERRGRAA